jgi:hypothetical protein
MRLLAMLRNSSAEPLAIVGNSQRNGLTAALVRAFARLAITDKELAAMLQLHPSQFCRQREGRDGHYLHVQRVDLLPDEYHALLLDALIDELARLRGRAVVTPQGQCAAMAKALRAMGEAVDAMSAAQPQAVLPFERKVV